MSIGQLNGLNLAGKTKFQGVSGSPQGAKGAETLPQNKTGETDKIDVFKPNNSPESNVNKPEENPALNGLNDKDTTKKGLDLNA
jgi:hypothetical protein